MTFDEWFAINVGLPTHSSSYALFKRCWETAYEEGAVVALAHHQESSVTKFINASLKGL